MDGKILILFTLFITLKGTLAGEWCANYSTDGSNLWDKDASKVWCDGGCCGDGLDQHCCIFLELLQMYKSTAAMLIGTVIKSIAFVAIIVSVLVAVLCCCRKSRGRVGYVYQPTTVQVQGMQATNMTYGLVGYKGAVNYPVVATSNMAPAQAQQWQPLLYDQVYAKTEQPPT